MGSIAQTIGPTPPHPRVLGWVGTTALAMGGSNQMIFIITALFVGQGDILGQGSAAVPLLIVGVFALSAMLASFAGALQGYSLGFAAPDQSVAPLIFATTATLLGGVPLSGGRGNPLGIAAGVLSLAFVTEAIPILHSAEYVNSLVPALLLLIVVLVDAPYVLRWWKVLKARRGSRPGLRGADPGAAAPAAD